MPLERCRSTDSFKDSRQLEREFGHAATAVGAHFLGGQRALERENVLGRQLTCRRSAFRAVDGPRPTAAAAAGVDQQDSGRLHRREIQTAGNRAHEREPEQRPRASTGGEQGSACADAHVANGVRGRRVATRRGPPESRHARPQDLHLRARQEVAAGRGRPQCGRQRDRAEEAASKEELHIWRHPGVHQ